MPLRRRIAIIAVTLAASLTLLGGMIVALEAAGSALAETERESRTYGPGIDTIDVDVGAGEIDVVARPGTTRVRVTRVVRHFLRRPEVSSEIRGGVLRLRTDCSDGLPGPCSTSFRIEAPPAVAVVAESSAGDVGVRGMAGRLRLRTTAGDVELREVRSRSVESSSTAGDVEADLLVAPTSLEARSTAGDVDVRVPAGTYSVDTETIAGDEGTVGLVDDPAAPRRIRVETTAGDVTVRAR